MSSDHQTILNHLNAIEQEHDVKIIIAIESGSRAWGFPSRDSDFDVRFVYVHPQDWYLQVFEQRDVIELPVDAVLDIGGWELRKALRLLWKSNPPLLEWLSSPIIYRQHETLKPLQTLSKQAFLAKSACHHYLSMAKRYADKIKQTPQANAKAYLSALRTTLCCQWIIKRQTQPPMEFPLLAQALLTDSKLSTLINQLIEDKKDATESVMIDRLPLLDDYLSHQLAFIEQHIPENNRQCTAKDFDNTFKTILDMTTD